MLLISTEILNSSFNCPFDTGSVESICPPLNGVFRMGMGRLCFRSLGTGGAFGADFLAAIGAALIDGGDADAVCKFSSF